MLLQNKKISLNISDNMTMLHSLCGQYYDLKVLSLDNIMTLQLTAIAAFFPQRRYFNGTYKQGLAQSSFLFNLYEVKLT